MVIRIRIPAPSSMAVANLLAVLGLVAIVVAVGGMLGVWPAVLTGGVFAVVLGWVGMAQAAAVEQAPPAAASTAPAPVVRAAEEPSAA
ncbi:hypothetical protein NQK81_13335 [Amycolatopsis roodepoortensis]|uniref:hypothetical protein n=1 Tax=Amycolatopsis roodepoortensis TaxID=700274 RepID=UPI00214B6202|nr:hypothetical protein [Amycolatopsis roodepoortensis]UUV34388.1 hypothetical protein NQK81_13335 [Amycolatopsis roodepoortensis]